MLRDRDALRDRLFGVVEILSALLAVERTAMAAIGFCAPWATGAPITGLRRSIC
jgi:hypothetical protein